MKWKIVVAIAMQCEGGHPEMSKPKKCKASDGCKNFATKPHICPYRREIDDDEKTLCECCEVCESNCADDI